jgi:molybdenum cofactor synthesis domain-containing protein
MTDETAEPKIVTAALLVIGEEILSGRTQDANTAHIAAYLTRVGIALREVRVVADDVAEIATAINELRRRYTYLFTTGGIGPTHDDVTTDAIGEAFGVAVAVRDDAVASMREHYSDEDLSPARLRMARIPEGASLIHNAISRAPGYMLENVIVMAGVPRIMQVMLDEVMPRLVKGRPLRAHSIRLDVAEGDLAPPLAALQTAHPNVQIGSYPFFETDRKGTHVVLRAADDAMLQSALQALRSLIAREGFKAGGVDEA